MIGTIRRKGRLWPAVLMMFGDQMGKCAGDHADAICRLNEGMVGVGTREEGMRGGDPCGRPRPRGSIRPGGTQDTHKGPLVRSTTTRVPTLWRGTRLVSGPSFPASVGKHHQDGGARHIKRTAWDTMQQTASISPISTNIRATNFRVSGKYANMGNSKTQRMPKSFIILMLLKALIVRSTTQKDISLSAPAGAKLLRGSEMHRYRLFGTDKLVAIVIEGT